MQYVWHILLPLINVIIKYLFILPSPRTFWIGSTISALCAVSSPLTNSWLPVSVALFFQSDETPNQQVKQSNKTGVWLNERRACANERDTYFFLYGRHVAPKLLKRWVLLWPRLCFNWMRSTSIHLSVCRARGSFVSRAHSMPNRQSKSEFWAVFERWKINFVARPHNHAAGHHHSSHQLY